MISIIIPLFNEEGNLEILFERIIKAIQNISNEYEILFIDDGSTDSSLRILKHISQKNQNVHVYSFRKNRGKSEALTYGFQQSKGTYIVTLDADLQDKPEEISRMIKKLKEGYDLVCGWRVKRKDAKKMKFISKIFNTSLQILWGLKIHDYNCGLKAYSKEAAKSLQMYGGMHRFIPILISQQGFSVAEIPVEHDKRLFGKSKFGFGKVFTDLPDMFTIFFLLKYGKKPLHFFGIAGVIFLIIGFLILLYLTGLKFSGQRIGNRPLFFLGLLLVINGFQTFFAGFIADLVINVSQNNNKTLLSDASGIKYKSDSK